MRVCKRCGDNRADRFFVGKRGRLCLRCRKGGASDAARNRRLAEHYEVTPEEWERILEMCGHKCAGCKQKRSYRLNVDHDHKVEREQGMRASVRGPLCRRCNKLLRDCRDNIDILIWLAEYLRAPPARKVLDQ
jgi:hypothetical protein